jgi:hypothetical protein
MCLQQETDHTLPVQPSPVEQAVMNRTRVAMVDIVVFPHLNEFRGLPGRAKSVALIAIWRSELGAIWALAHIW